MLQGCYSSRGEKNLFEVAIERLEHTSKYWSMLFFYGRGDYTVKEALEKIRCVEESNQAAYQELEQEMNRYEQQKKLEIQNLEKSQKELRIKALNDLENSLIEEEERYRMFLLQQTKENNQRDETLYEEHKETLIQQIINEMRGNYGG